MDHFVSPVHPNLTIFGLLEETHEDTQDKENMPTTLKDPNQHLGNPGPSYCEATALPTVTLPPQNVKK